MAVGEDVGPGGAPGAASAARTYDLDARRTGGTMVRPGKERPLLPGVVVLVLRERCSSLYRHLVGRIRLDGGFAPVAHLNSGPSTRPEDVAWRLPERRAGWLVVSMCQMAPDSLRATPTRATFFPLADDRYDEWLRTEL